MFDYLKIKMAPPSRAPGRLWLVTGEVDLTLISSHAEKFLGEGGRWVVELLRAKRADKLSDKFSGRWTGLGHLDISHALASKLFLTRQDDEWAVKDVGDVKVPMEHVESVVTIISEAAQMLFLASISSGVDQTASQLQEYAIDNFTTFPAFALTGEGSKWLHKSFSVLPEDPTMHVDRKSSKYSSLSVLQRRLALLTQRKRREAFAEYAPPRTRMKFRVPIRQWHTAKRREYFALQQQIHRNRQKPAVSESREEIIEQAILDGLKPSDIGYHDGDEVIWQQCWERMKERNIKPHFSLHDLSSSTYH